MAPWFFQLHEITHISIGLEDIHPPAFWELLDEIKQQYSLKLQAGEVSKETDAYGCKDAYITGEGEVSNYEESAASSSGNIQDNTLGDDGELCGARKAAGYRRRGGRGFRSGNKRSSVQAMGITAAEKQQKRRPLKKGVKMIDKRTKDGKAKVAALKTTNPRELAARAALDRFQQSAGAGSAIGDNSNSSVTSKGELSEINTRAEESASDDDKEIEVLEEHPLACGCRCCDWDRMLFHRTV
jgi:hypothetical protein